MNGAATRFTGLAFTFCFGADVRVDAGVLVTSVFVTAFLESFAVIRVTFVGVSDFFTAGLFAFVAKVITLPN
jgi:hypothetical protein